MKKFDRGKVARIDCPKCRGNGYVKEEEHDVPCPRCGGLGMLEEEVGELPSNSQEDLQNIFPDVENPTNRFDQDSTK